MSEESKKKTEKIMKRLDELIQTAAKEDFRFGRAKYRWELGKEIMAYIPYPDQVKYVTMIKVRGIEVHVNVEEPEVIKLWREVTA